MAILRCHEKRLVLRTAIASSSSQAISPRLEQGRGLCHCVLEYLLPDRSTQTGCTVRGKSRRERNVACSCISCVTVAVSPRSANAMTVSKPPSGLPHHSIFQRRDPDAGLGP